METKEDKKSFQKADQRYKSIRNRSFDYSFELLLLEQIIKEGDKNLVVSDKQIKEFFNRVDKSEIIEKNRKSWQISKDGENLEGCNNTVKEIDVAIKSWYDIDDNYRLYKDNKKWFEGVFMSKKDFRDIYGPDDFKERRCDYCGITENKIDELISKSKIYTKRLYSRGRSLEIDKKEPNKDYTPENIVLSCYWCNNAKTDEYTYDEFKRIGVLNRLIWENRYNDTNWSSDMYDQLEKELKIVDKELKGNEKY